MGLPNMGGFDVSGIIGGLQNGMVSLLIAFHLPIYGIWLLMTAYFLITFVLNNLIIIFPWDYKIKATKIIPYADKRIGIMNDKGAYCREKGMLRFKLKNEPFPFPKPNAGDQYENGEVVIVAISKTKMAYAKRILDWEKKKIYINMGATLVSDLAHFDRIIMNFPDWIKTSMEKNLVVMIMYCIITIILMASNFFTILPLLWRSIFGCGVWV